MEDQEKTTISNKKATKPKAASTVVLTHDSNPFTTTINGIKKVFRFNISNLVGTIVFSLFLGALMVATLATMALALVAFIIQQNVPDSAPLIANLPPEAVSFATNMSVSSIYATWAIGLLLAILLGTFIQAIQLSLVAASANSQAIGFGDLLQQSSRRVLPLLGLMAIVAMVIIASIVVLMLLSQITGPVIAVLIIIAIVIALYLYVRLIFATFSIIEEGLGPMAALKRSIALTKGHFVETMGIVAVTALFVLAPSLLFDLLSSATNAPVSSIIMFISMIVSLIVSTIVGVGFAERFVQLRNIKNGAVVATKTHVMNYVAILLMMLGYMIASTLSKPHSGYDHPYNNSKQLEEHNRGWDDTTMPESDASSYNLH